MRPWLYLDTARLGQMSPAAQLAQQDFARFVGEVGGAIQIDDLLRDGFENCAASVQRRYPGLNSWHGLTKFKAALGKLVAADPSSPTYVAARSAELMKLAARLLSCLCRNILITDLGWPPYHQILESCFQRPKQQVMMLPLTSSVVKERLNAAEVIERICGYFEQQQCEGLFLTAVSSQGIRLPVSEIAGRLAARARVIVVDGAQDFCHSTERLSNDCYDLYLTGCHKWLGGYQPLGVAFPGRLRWRRTLDQLLQEAIEQNELTDPLLRYLECLARDGRTAGETANLAPLFSAAGAIQDAGYLESLGNASRFENAVQVAELATQSGWRPRLPEQSLQTGIVLLEADSPVVKAEPAEQLRRAFQEQGVALTAYSGGQVRLSMPKKPLSADERIVLTDALSRTA